MYTEKVISNFWSKVLVGDKLDCWLWFGSKQKNGYGNMCIGNKQTHSAHRVSYIIHKGKIPDGFSVMHKCDNKLCVNPNHLSIGTHKDNSHDMLKKGRKWLNSKNKLNSFEKLALDNMKKRIELAKK